MAFLGRLRSESLSLRLSIRTIQVKKWNKNCTFLSLLTWHTMWLSFGDKLWENSFHTLIIKCITLRGTNERSPQRVSNNILHKSWTFAHTMPCCCSTLILYSLFCRVWLVKCRYLVSMICSALFINGVSAWAFILKYRARVIIIHNLLVLFPP